MRAVVLRDGIQITFGGRPLEAHDPTAEARSKRGRRQLATTDDSGPVSHSELVRLLGTNLFSMARCICIGMGPEGRAGLEPHSTRVHSEQTREDTDTDERRANRQAEAGGAQLLRINVEQRSARPRQVPVDCKTGTDDQRDDRRPNQKSHGRILLGDQPRRSGASPLFRTRRPL